MVKLEMPPESESAVLLDRVGLADDLEVDFGVANMVYIYEALNSTVQVYDLFKVGDRSKSKPKYKCRQQTGGGVSNILTKGREVA